MNSPGWYVPNMLLENSGEIAPERMKRLSQSKNHTQLWIGLVMEARSDAEKAILQHVCSWNVRSWNVRSMN